MGSSYYVRCSLPEDDNDDDNDAPFLSLFLHQKNSFPSFPVELPSFHAIADLVDLHPKWITMHYSIKMDVHSFIFLICQNTVFIFNRWNSYSLKIDSWEGMLWMVVLWGLQERREKMFDRAGWDGGVLDAWNAIWMRDGIIGEGVGVAAPKFVMPWLVNG